MIRYRLQEPQSMSDARDNDDRVDFEEGSYSEMEDEVEEEQVEEYEEEEEEDEDDDNAGNQNVEEHEEEDYGDTKGGDREDDQEEIAEDDDNHIDIETADDDDDEKPASPIDDEVKEKYSQLLSLPPHGSEVFIGGLPRDVGEEDLRDLCEEMGEIFEVRLMKDRDSVIT
ncbi:PREDICTED: glutamic acid-rich protein-like [Camelina sativa]|uniref:Glutamic acid-rich protein-like n=1 Tax=Camelina sativa TaxID=90675 RepID=A0ABM0VJ29_CAMSA|nr:PREDICTED: glutamic acid-rich protein-like [Camelina sativa]